MAPAALPLAKLAGLLIKTISKPVAKQIKHSAIKYGTSRSALMSVGQASHAITTRMTIWSSGYKVRSISKLEDEAALSRGADLLSEAIVFSVAAGVTTYEYLRSSESSKKKEEAQLQKIRDDAMKLQAKLNSLDKRLVALEEYAKANRSSISLLRGGKEYVEPKAVVPIDDREGDGNFAILEPIDEPQQQDEGDPNNNAATDEPSSVKSKRSWWPF
ncbi:OPA3 family protein [Skeletonema marinoi]|uniref:OPA3 family protein n=1 Tax=Skeletonema marinoi TaxID=267567 RepID=A0A7S2PMH6_9STRA|nr:OPA3 family protein [Skeletonema marinoi]|mmetsp:Transcript_25009/g.42499  ORF Transcript_25009/g.42499 Transcript_25009/m.42499 type:complete len:216 (+) Transcript_25009:161-808(+)